MVESKTKKWSYFTVFVAPCLVLYIIFFILPFFRGIGISLTNWDGLTPKVPIVLEKNEFEEKILDNIKNQKDKDFVLSIYNYESDDDSYHRIGIKGKNKRKLERIVRKAGFEPEKNKFVGLENYKKIFTGKASRDFYPYTENIARFTKTSNVPLFINDKDFKREIEKSLKKYPQYKDLISGAFVYNKEKGRYVLKSEYDEFLVTDSLWELSELESGSSFSENDMDIYIRELKKLILDSDKGVLDSYTAEFLKKYNVSSESEGFFYEVNENLVKIGQLKNALSEVWVVKERRMGVIGFTLFFAVFSVLGINLLAFALALALDTGIRGQKVLRTIYFLPNVLSMIIVALIWSMLFVQLLPAITGVDSWISDSHKTPWLLVFVAVWQGAGYYMIVYLAGLQNIPNEIIEAAMIDGATPWQRFKFITIPMMVPSLTISFFLTIANAFKSFDLIYALLGQTGYATGTVPIVMDIYFDAFANKQAGLANAKAMILFFVIVLVTGIQLVSMKKKEIEA